MTSPAPGLSRPSCRTARSCRVLAATAAAALVALVGACSSGGDDASSAGGSSADYSIAAPQAAADAPRASSDEAGATSSMADAAGAADTSGAVDTATATSISDSALGDPRSLIRTGNVALRSDDVPTARFDLGKVLDAHGGEVAEESTQADDDGNAERVRLVLRVPVDEFDATMTGLTDVAELSDVTTDTQDVSTEVIDNSVRVELAKRSIDRISILLDNAGDLRDIVSIERELSSREADLGSLEQRQAFLADQTAMSTITVSIEPPLVKKEKDAPAEKDDAGFLAGLDGGWTALKDVTTGLLTVGGAVLPFALVVLALGVPARLLVRRLTPRSPSAGVTAEPAPTA